MAAAAVGVSHLVQSTRAGANFGFDLLLIILLANLFKYPFFEYGHRYFASTGKTLLHGYKQLGQGYLLIFLCLNLITAIASVAAVTFVTGALCQNLFTDQISLTVWCLILLLACVLLLSVGHYHILDLFIKALMIVLLFATIIAVGAAIQQGPIAPIHFEAPSPWSWTHLGFIIALMGWMPAPIELSVWQSLWMEAKERHSGERTSLKNAKIDFNFGYLMTVILAIAFCSLGALVMHGSNAQFSSTPAMFASQVVDLYTHSLGEWARPVISLAAFTTMFSTTITLVDAYPRSLADGTRIAFNKMNWDHRKFLNIWIFGVCIFSLLIIWHFRNHLKAMVDLVTIMAFLAAPFFAFINFKLIRSELVPKQDRPGTFLKLLSHSGLFFLVGFAGLYIYSCWIRN